MSISHFVLSSSFNNAAPFHLFSPSLKKVRYLAHILLPAGCKEGRDHPELQKRADRADQSVLFFLAGTNFWEKHAKNRRKHAKTGENRRKTGAFLVLIFLGEKLVGTNFYAFCNYALKMESVMSSFRLFIDKNNSYVELAISQLNLYMVTSICARQPQSVHSNYIP